ncbi:FabD/lysophospholipase-like protein [Melanomma pulvis-pyrius CBS 109.77]|uniref:FabD/lysophospholipase-like protein n=1 Tax=Melanomma pulvis-pyrius CBS 109.77 TaxID=1314802 RepID=A0A6A6X1D8_9PLEO|nr:FabD/lysophospholipase-like protein [Melanomma pulvis-pyrius CBS 109.77]
MPSDICGIHMRVTVRNLVLLLASSQSSTVPVFVFLRPLAISTHRRIEAHLTGKDKVGFQLDLNELDELFQRNSSGTTLKGRSNEDYESSSIVPTFRPKEVEGTSLEPNSEPEDGEISLGLELEALRSKGYLKVQCEDGTLFLGLAPEIRQDGGGIRGYWTLLVLKTLMDFIISEEGKQANSSQTRFDSFWPEQNPKASLGTSEQGEFLPYHYFDIICGEGTGSWGAMMLSNFRLPVEQCLEKYIRLTHRIFGKPRRISQLDLGIIGRSKFSAEKVEQEFKYLTGLEGNLIGGVSIAPRFATDTGVCATLISTLMATEIDAQDGRVARGVRFKRKKHLIRSYDHMQRDPIPISDKAGINYGLADKMAIWQVARAATADPLYFKPFKYNVGNRTVHLEGTAGYGGFIKIAIQEIISLHGEESVGAVVSVGTAIGRRRDGIFLSTLKAFDLPDSAYPVGDVLNGSSYWRFDDQTGINIRSDDWKPNGSSSDIGKATMNSINNAFKKWATKPENIESLQECARELVTRRRGRTRNSTRWKLYATGVPLRSP